jgi:pimeloyl-ACP methyl ester carboxylesterase
VRTASPDDPSLEIHWRCEGDGRSLLLGFPMLASQREVFGEPGEATLRGYLERLTDAYRVLLVDYPSIGGSCTIHPDQLTAERVCSDLLAVADDAGFDRFAYWGYSWGSMVGLQLATRSDRLSALVVGGWVPLGGFQHQALEGALLQVDHPPESAKVVLRSDAQYAQWVTFYRSVASWRERDEVAKISCPRIVFTGADATTDAGGIPMPMAESLRSLAPELEALGWRVLEIPDRDFTVVFDPDAVVPRVRAELDEVLGLGGGGGTT